MITSTIVDQLVARRRQLGLSQRDVANKMGLGSSGQTHLASIELGHIRNPRADVLNRIAAVLGVEIVAEVVVVDELRG